MPVFNTSARLPLASLLLVLPALACADASLTYGTGPDEYRSYALKANVGIFNLPLELDLDHFQARASGVSDTKQTGAGLTWNATDLFSANYRQSVTDDGTFEVDGKEGGFTFGLDTLWEGELRTTLDAGYGDFKYIPTDIARAKLSSKLTVTQTRRSIGLSQDITPTLTLYGSHDQYEYDRNPKTLAFAVALLRRTLNTAKLAFTLLSFPDKANSLGMSWRPQDKLMLDLSIGKTTTVLEQEQKNTRLGVDYQLSDKLNLAVALTRSSSSALVNSTGITVQKETRDTYTEVSAGWMF